MSSKNKSLLINNLKIKKTTKTKSLFLVALIFISSVFIIPLTQYTQANATIDFNSMDRIDEIDLRIKSLLYLDAMSLCFKYSRLADGSDDKGGIEPTDVENGIWFTKDDKQTYVPMGVYLNDGNDPADVGKDGWINCGNQYFVPTALGLWGFESKDYASILCHAGYFPTGIEKDGGTDRANKQANIDQCLGLVSDGTPPKSMNRIAYGKESTDTLRANSANDFYAYIKEAAYGGLTPALATEFNDPNAVVPHHIISDQDAESLYYFYLFTLERSCIPGITNPTTIEKQKSTKFTTDYAYNDVNLLYINPANDNKAETILTNFEGKISPTYLVLTLPWRNAEMDDEEINHVDAGDVKYIRETSAYGTYGNAIAPWVASIQTSTLEKYLGDVSHYESCEDLVDDMEYYLPQAIKAQNDRSAEDRMTSEQMGGYLDVKDAENGSEDTTTCAVGGVGWIVCPVMTFLGTITDSAFSFLANNFLSTNSNLLSTDSGTYTAWKAMRNFANVAFVIVFLIIIFSQVTSFGVSNYGIKKLLPKLIIAAILVNVSFFICQIAVDLSNIAGYSLNGLFDGITKSITVVSTGTNIAAGALTIAGLVVAALAAGATLLLSVTVPVLLAALAAVLMTVLILLLRTSLIVILVVISPLAFVAYLLPNTEQWFKKWGKTFSGLLLVFPIIALVFGGGKLAGQILNNSAQDEPILQLIALGVSVVPLFMVPGLLKGSMNAAGSIGTKLAGLSSKANSGIGQKVKSTSMFGSYSAARARNNQIKRAQITGGVYRGRNGITRIVSGANARLNASKISGDMGTRNAQQAAQLANKLDIENVTAAKAQIQQANITNDDLIKLSNGESVRGINGRDSSTKAAAMESLLERGKYSDFEKTWNKMVNDNGSEKGGSEVMRVVASTLARSSSNPTFMGAGDLQNAMEGHKEYQSKNSAGVMVTNHLNLEEIAERGVEANRYSTVKLVAASNDELEYIKTNSNTAGKASLARAADAAFSTPEIEQNIKQNRKKLDELSSAPGTHL